MLPQNPQQVNRSNYFDTWSDEKLLFVPEARKKLPSEGGKESEINFRSFANLPSSSCPVLMSGAKSSSSAHPSIEEEEEEEEEDTDSQKIIYVWRLP